MLSRRSCDVRNGGSMKVFISCSGDASERAAEMLRGWLSTVLHVDSFVAKESLRAGSRWREDLRRELADTAVGIACLTRDNLDSRWINFEMGAVSKLDRATIIPFVIDHMGRS